MIRLVGTLVIFALYFSVGVYHVLKVKKKPGESRKALIAYGAIWMVLGTSYFWAGFQQVLHEVGWPLADKTSFYCNCTCAIGVIVPYYYFASYLLWGDHVLSRRLMALAVAFFAVGTGLIWSTPVVLREFGWGSIWSFQGYRVELYFQLVGALPILASLAAFMLFLYPQNDSQPARYRLAMTTLSFALVLAAWATLVTINSASNIAAIVLSLASGFSAHLAYFPLPFIRRRIERA